MRAHAAFVDAGLGDVGAVGFALVGLLLRDVLQDRGDAARRLAIGNARAHHAGTQNADFLRFVARHAFGARLA